MTSESPSKKRLVPIKDEGNMEQSPRVVAEIVPHLTSAGNPSPRLEGHLTGELQNVMGKVGCKEEENSKLNNF